MPQFIVFLSAFLLFQMQPFLGRYILPWFGGSPAVWAACLLVFQTLLLAGYGYAHWLPRIQMHWLLLAGSLAFLPLGPNAEIWKPVAITHPTPQVAWLLLATAGLPYFLLSSTGPLVQRWVHATGANPYRLYAYSNAGSLLGLLSYPFVLEPLLTLRMQGWLWSVLYVVYAGAIALYSRQHRQVPPDEAARVPVRSFAGWMALSACGTALLMTATNQITQDIAISPFLWVLPLCLYLLTFLLTFDKEDNYQRIPYALRTAVLVPAACAATIVGLRLPLWVHLIAACGAMFSATMLCHGELAKSKPEPSKLTTFYLAMASGGALGSLMVAVVAPILTTSLAEYPIALAAACILALVSWRQAGFTAGTFWFRAARTGLIFAAAIALLSMEGAELGQTIAASRNFFGVLRVTGDSVKRTLKHGRITHGFQFLDNARKLQPTAYFGHDSGIGLAMRHMDRRPLRTGVIGLGVATIAAYGREGDTIRFYEINPDVERFARAYFTYLSSSRARTEVIIGDARIQLEREEAEPYDILVIDAFSSDAIPAHLLTAEAAAVYRRRLKDDGLLVMHLTNQYLELPPLARGIAARLGWQAVRVRSAEDAERGTARSTWVVVTGNPAVLAAIAPSAVAWGDGDPAPTLWTDDSINLLKVVKLR
ncbi:MAG: fused MFS/spermidine synthase [Bryobacterales bacterium]|nr:fused MFS/spermidine synthase [Bryobacterales bacterium]